MSASEAIAFDIQREQQKVAVQAAVAAEAPAHEAALAGRIRNLQVAEANTQIAAEAIPPRAVPYQVPPIPDRAINLSLTSSNPNLVRTPATIQSTPHGYAPSSVPVSLGVLNTNRYDPNSLANPYGAGSPFKADGLMNPYSQYGNKFSSKSWTNLYASEAPKLYGAHGSYHGRLSANPYALDSTSNQFGRYGNRFSPESINNPFGAGNPYSSQPIYVRPQ